MNINHKLEIEMYSFETVLILRVVDVPITDKWLEPYILNLPYTDCELYYGRENKLIYVHDRLSLIIDTNNVNKYFVQVFDSTEEVDKIINALKSLIKSYNEQYNRKMIKELGNKKIKFVGRFS